MGIIKDHFAITSFSKRPLSHLPKPELIRMLHFKHLLKVWCMQYYKLPDVSHLWNGSFTQQKIAVFLWNYFSTCLTIFYSTFTFGKQLNRQPTFYDNVYELSRKPSSTKFMQCFQSKPWRTLPNTRCTSVTNLFITVIRSHSSQKWSSLMFLKANNRTLNHANELIADFYTHQRAVRRLNDRKDSLNNTGDPPMNTYHTAFT